MKRMHRVALWVIAFGLLLAPAACPPEREPVRAPSLALRLLGPIASLAASAQWVRVDTAIRAGRTDLALARAETALGIDPSSTAGWIYLARHLAFDLASPDREPDPQRRLGWVQAAIAVLERGESSADDPAELCVWQGLILATNAAFEPPVPWPEGARGLWLAAATRFERASTLGHRVAAELATIARSEAERAREHPATSTDQ